ncbi:hypothetical protein JOE11_000426 [Robbsia andropogonis]|uniref:hypothetical protein n=1 Tax=Robbsia andropogonis TaxID=28092 RepID=UPI003D213D0C
MTDIEAGNDMDKDENVAGLIRFLLKWSCRLARIPFGNNTPEQLNWNSVAFNNNDRLTPDAAETLALRMLNPSEKLRPYEVFLLAFWKVMQTPERLYLKLLDEHRNRFFYDIFGIRANHSIRNEVIEDVSRENAFNKNGEDDKVFILRTRHRFLNVDDLGKGIARRFPQFRVRIEARVDDPKMNSAAMKLAILRKEPDGENRYTLSELEQEHVRRFLNETTSVYAKIRPEFNHAHAPVEVTLEWREGIDPVKAASTVDRAFREWTWTLWRFEEWNEGVLRNEVIAFISSQNIAKSFKINFTDGQAHFGLLTLNLLPTIK